MNPTRKKKKDKQPPLVGFARREITPAISLDMGGYIARTEPAIGMHDPLFVRAVSFNAGGQSVLLLSLDILHLSADWCKTAKQKLAEALGVPREHILLAAIHTHSGPAVFSPLNRGGALATYEEHVLDACGEAAINAVAAAEPSVLKAASSTTMGVARNRRGLLEPTEVLLSVIRIETLSKEVRGHLVSYSCHPTVMPPSNLEYSADLFGAAASAVEEKYPGSFCVLFNGAAGDLSTRFTRKGQDWPELERLGKRVAGQIIGASRSAKAVKVSPPSVKVARMSLPFREVLAADQARETLDVVRKKYDNLRIENGRRGKERAVFRSKLEGALAQLLISRLGGWESLFGASRADIELQVMRLGDLIFCGLPGEFFGRRGRELARAARPGFAIVIGYANGYWGYLVPPKEGSKGGYEAMMAPLAPSDEPKVIRHMKALIAKIKKDSTQEAHARRRIRKSS